MSYVSVRLRIRAYEVCLVKGNSNCDLYKQSKNVNIIFFIHNIYNMIPMIIISIIAGLLSSMNIWTYHWKDIRLHINDLYMALLMTAWMITLNELYHFHHVKTLIIGIISIVIIIYLIRNQIFVDDKQFINGMIPHHSMALLMSEKIKDKTQNKKIVELANNIIQSQTEEINIMNNILS